MKITQTRLREIIQEEVATVTENAYRAGGRALNRVRATEWEDVAGILANLADDLQAMNMSRELLWLVSNAHVDAELHESGSLSWRGAEQSERSLATYVDAELRLAG